MLIRRQKYLKCGTFGQQTPKVDQMPQVLSQLLVLANYGTQVWFLIFVICFLCFSAKSISSVVLLVNKIKTLSSSPPKQVLGPIARFRPKRYASLVLDLFNLLVVF